MSVRVRFDLVGGAVVATQLNRCQELFVAIASSIAVDVAAMGDPHDLYD